jgi:hypothetical protein
VAKQLHDVENVLGSMIFHCCLPVAKAMKGYLVYPWVAEFVGNSFPAGPEIYP